jgi:hypothetical protein
MKKLFVVTMAFFCFYAAGNAQVSLGLSVNIGSQPAWGPTGYDHVDYYYLPDIDAYYNVPAKQFTYLEGNRWVTRATLPPRYRNYDLFGSYKVVVNEKNPFRRADYYRTTYAKYKGWRGQRQQVIRDSREDKYRRGRDRDHDHDHH